MIIIKNGTANKKGIYFTCKTCSCEYIIENRNDWKIEWVTGIKTGKKYPIYITVCPECENEYSFGSDPDEVCKNNGCLYYINGKSQIIFHRQDWDERFKVTEK